MLLVGRHRQPLSRKHTKLLPHLGQFIFGRVYFDLKESIQLIQELVAATLTVCTGKVSTRRLACTLRATEVSSSSCGTQVFVTAEAVSPNLADTVFIICGNLWTAPFRRRTRSANSVLWSKTMLHFDLQNKYEFQIAGAIKD